MRVPDPTRAPPARVATQERRVGPNGSRWSHPLLQPPCFRSKEERNPSFHKSFTHTPFGLLPHVSCVAPAGPVFPPTDRTSTTTSDGSLTGKGHDTVRHRRRGPHHCPPPAPEVDTVGPNSHLPHGEGPRKGYRNGTTLNGRVRRLHNPPNPGFPLLVNSEHHTPPVCGVPP